MGVRKLIALAYCIDAATSQSAFLQSHLDNTTANTTVNATTYGALGSTVSQCGSDYHRIYIIRHGERWDKYSGLNECGKARAKHLVEIFGEGHSGPRSMPEELYAFDYSRSGPLARSQQRCSQTLEDLAKDLGKTVKYVPSSNPGTWNAYPTDCHHSPPACTQDTVAAEVLHEQIQDVPTIIVAWEHSNIHLLVHALTGNEEWSQKVAGDKWPDCEFGRVISIHFKRGEDGKYHHCSFHLSDQKCAACHSPYCNNDCEDCCKKPVCQSHSYCHSR